MLQLICLIMSKCREGSKHFLLEPDLSKTFWQLGCQVATLFLPLLSSLHSVVLMKLSILVFVLPVRDILQDFIH